MLHLTFITIGDLPRGPFQEIGDKFKKQLQAYVKMDHKVLKDASRILDAVPPNDTVIILDEYGKQLTSNATAQIIKELEDSGTHVTVILGGAKGLSDEIKARADILLGLSTMTTTHDMAHIFFLEQLYRIFTIIKGKEYHY